MDECRGGLSALLRSLCAQVSSRPGRHRAWSPTWPTTVLTCSSRWTAASCPGKAARTPPFAGAAGLSGARPVDVPPDFYMVGFLLLVNGHLEKTAGSQAAVTCSTGHGTQSLSWPLAIGSSDPDRDPVTGSDFRLECFTSDYHPAMVGCRLTLRSRPSPSPWPCRPVAEQPTKPSSSTSPTSLSSCSGRRKFRPGRTWRLTGYWRSGSSATCQSSR